jgi:hypothetical protein
MPMFAGKGDHQRRLCLSYFVRVSPALGDSFIVNAEYSRTQLSLCSCRRTIARRVSCRRDTISTSTLPLLITRLIGRDVAATTLNEQLDRERMVTVLGSGGIGKTSLVLDVAPTWLAKSGYEAHFVDLALVSEASDVLTTVASTIFGTKLQPNRDRL